MTLNTIELKNGLFNSPVESTKDKVLSMRVEEGMHKLLADLTKELDTKTVSQTARKILRFYLLNAIYEEEWKRLHSKSFKIFAKEVARAGPEIEIQKYKRLLEDLQHYVELMRAIIDRINVSASFFESEMSKLEEVTEKLEEADILWKKEK